MARKPTNSSAELTMSELQAHHEQHQGAKAYKIELLARIATIVCLQREKSGLATLTDYEEGYFHAIQDVIKAIN